MVLTGLVILVSAQPGSHPREHPVESARRLATVWQRTAVNGTEGMGPAGRRAVLTKPCWVRTRSGRPRRPSQRRSRRAESAGRHATHTGPDGSGSGSNPGHHASHAPMFLPCPMSSTRLGRDAVARPELTLQGQRLSSVLMGREGRPRFIVSWRSMRPPPTRHGVRSRAGPANGGHRRSMRATGRSHQLRRLKPQTAWSGSVFRGCHGGALGRIRTCAHGSGGRCSIP